VAGKLWRQRDTHAVPTSAECLISTIFRFLAITCSPVGGVAKKGAEDSIYQIRKEQLKKRDFVGVKQGGTMSRDVDMVVEHVP